MCGGVVAEVVEGGELAGGGLDEVAGLVQETADVAGVAADELVADAEQGGGGRAGQAVAVAQDEGQQFVGEGQAGPGAGAGGVLAGAAAAPPVQGGLAEGGGRQARAAVRASRAGPVMPVMAGWASQARSGPGTAGAAGGAAGAAGAGSRV